MPAAGISLPRRSNTTVAQAHDAADPNAAAIPIHSIPIALLLEFELKQIPLWNNLNIVSQFKAIKGQLVFYQFS